MPAAREPRPAPEEIAACEPHLFRQIELIEPKLVATLGNFATKLLSGRPAGITRVHGHEQEVTLGARRCSLYPLYHPAAALYTPSMLKVLEEDFARIPALLERRGEEPAPCRGPTPRAGVEPSPSPSSSACSDRAASSSPAHRRSETEAVAARLAARLALGDVVTVSGELGLGEDDVRPRRVPGARGRRRR